MLLDIEQEDDSADVADTDSPADSATTDSIRVPDTPDGVAPPVASIQGPDGKPLATPAVRRVAKENGVALIEVAGTGKGGRILKSDVLTYMAGGGGGGGGTVASQPPSQPVPAAPSAPTPAASSSVESSVLAPIPVTGSSALPDEEVPVRGLQRAMVRSMDAAWAVPHFGYSDEVQLDALARLRKDMKPLAEERGVKLSYLPFILKATSMALRQFPSLNAWAAPDGSSVTLKGAHHIGVAMDTPRGLIVPNVKDCQDRSVMSIAGELARLQSLAAAGKLGEGDLKGGTFSLSNIGAIGGTYASPVLVVPQVAIGALGRMQKVPRVMSRGQARGLGVQAATLGDAWSTPESRGQ